MMGNEYNDNSIPFKGRSINEGYLDYQNLSKNINNSNCHPIFYSQGMSHLSSQDNSFNLHSSQDGSRIINKPQNNYGNSNKINFNLNSSLNSSLLNPKTIEDDEKVKNNITQQIKSLIFKNNLY